MKEQKPLRLAAGEQDQNGPESNSDQNGTRGAVQRPTVDRSPDTKELRPGPGMQNELPTRTKSRGRLGRDVQAKLGKTLQAYFDDVVREGVPDRFKDLLEHFDQRRDKGSNG